MGIINLDLFDQYDFLKKFNYNLWIKSIEKSQRLINGVNSINQNIMKILWDPYYDNNFGTEYCIKAILEDDSFHYLTQRGKVDKDNKSQTKKKVRKLKKAIKTASNEGNPFCYTSKNYIFGNLSTLLRNKEKGEECIEVVDVVLEKYNKTIGLMYNEIQNYYAPLIMIIVEEKPLLIDKYVVLISEPLDLKNYIKNWRRIDVDIEEYELLIIESDLEFDKKMNIVFRDDHKAVIDPMFDNNLNLTEGIIIENKYSIIKN